ncbi:MAG: hypothetical protein E7656_00400 [Ruminococcaceae bacterium]|nr:hypothetical protein [Oscillospiraceae bacterium]
MEFFTVKKDVQSDLKIVLDDMILTKDMPTTAGSKMLDGYMSLFDAQVITKLTEANYAICGKSAVGEFAFDLMGETNYKGALCADGKILNASAEIVSAGDATAAICLDANGSVRRAAAQYGLVSIKPTYGTVSRYGIVPVACSGDTVSVMAKSSDICTDVLSVIAGHDEKDGTSHSDELCAKLASGAEIQPVKKIALLKSMLAGANAEVCAKIEKAKNTLSENGIEVCEIDDSVICASRVAWNILMSAELCNNVSKYDGVKYGYRAQKFSNIDELYTNSRTEAFGELLKTAILFGSETLSTDNYMKVYDKALRMRRVIVEAFTEIFSRFDAVLMPACSSMSYPENIESTKAFEENTYTAPASITGLPAVVSGSVQLVGKAFSDRSLLAVAKILEKEGK